MTLQTILQTTQFLQPGRTGMIVIVSRNNLSLTRAAVRSAQAQVPPVDVLVVDNASSDGTVEWLSAQTMLRRISLRSQVSLAEAWNMALHWTMLTWGIDKVLVCNNDIVLREDTFALLSALGEEFVTCVSVDSPGQLGVPGDRDLAMLRASAREHPDYSCFMISRSVVDRVGWFDESYFPAYCEDSDHHVRMFRAGIRAICVDLPFLHLGAQTVATADPAERRRIERGADANRARFQAKYGCLPGSPEYEALFT